MSAGASINVSHVLCAINVDKSVELITLAEMLGADEVSLTYLKPYGAALAQGAPAPASAESLLRAFTAAALAADRARIGVRLFEVPLRVQAMLKGISRRVKFGGDAYCDTAEGQVRVSSDGNVFPCFAATKHMGLDKSDMTLAVRERPLGDIVSDAAVTAFQSRAHEALAATPHVICQNCSAFHARTCYPGCPFEPDNMKPKLCALLERAA